MNNCKWCQKLFKSNKQFKKYCSELCRKSYNDSFIRGKKKKKVKYHKSKYWSKLQGKSVLLKSGYERTYCEYMDLKKVKWMYECKRFYMEDGKTYYLPDFYLPELNEWHEVKGKWYSKSIKKFESFKKLYPREVIKVIDSKNIMAIRKELKKWHQL